ncbi:MAG: hypothetical protein NTV39_01645 [Candidatus Saccharibacteria bacterium]|nr:hypothetical protein [Candidatus Saccharibacteria bacterium]
MLCHVGIAFGVLQRALQDVPQTESRLLATHPVPNGKVRGEPMDTAAELLRYAG